MKNLFAILLCLAMLAPAGAPAAARGQGAPDVAAPMPGCCAGASGHGAAVAQEACACGQDAPCRLKQSPPWQKPDASLFGPGVRLPALAALATAEPAPARWAARPALAAAAPPPRARAPLYLRKSSLLI